MMDAQRQKLVERILKLLALASSTTFAAEAATARALADELIGKHNVSLGGKEDRAQFAVERWVPWARGAQWEFMIACAIGDLCGCEGYFHRKFEWFSFAGTVANLEALRFILGEIHRQRVQAWLSYKREGGEDNLWAFAFAFAHGLQDKIDMVLSDAKHLKQQKLAAKIWFESTHTIKNPDEWIRGRGSSEAGRNAGDGVSIHRGQLTPEVRRIDYQGRT